MSGGIDPISCEQLSIDITDIKKEIVKTKFFGHWIHNFPLLFLHAQVIVQIPFVTHDIN